jgi:hypothetical protein
MYVYMYTVNPQFKVTVGISGFEDSLKWMELNADVLPWDQTVK